MELAQQLINEFKVFLKISTAKVFTADIFKDKPYSIGKYTYGEPTVLYDDIGAELIIGNYCSLAKKITIFLGGNHRSDWVSTYPFSILTKYFPEGEGIEGGHTTKGNVVIGSDVWIGRGTTIMSGVTIGNGAVIAANSLITKDIPTYEIWGGNPARFIKKRFDDDTINKLNSIAWWNWDEQKVKDNIALLCNSNINLFIEKHYKEL